MSMNSSPRECVQSLSAAVRQRRILVKQSLDDAPEADTERRLDHHHVAVPASIVFEMSLPGHRGFFAVDGLDLGAEFVAQGTSCRIRRGTPCPRIGLTATGSGQFAVHAGRRKLAHFEHVTDHSDAPPPEPHRRESRSNSSAARIEAGLAL
jgi:hypothetical protein